MRTTEGKPSIAAMALALLMLLFGFVMSLFGYVAITDWRSERAALILCGLLWAVTGPAVFGSALWLLVLLGRSPLALCTGGTSISASGIALAFAVTVGALPCSGPT